MSTPHLLFPLRVMTDGRFGTVQQDSPEDVGQCVKCILKTRRGIRDDYPDLGLPNPAFRRGGTDLVEIERQISTFEERAEGLVDEDPAALVDALSIVHVQLEG